MFYNRFKNGAAPILTQPQIDVCRILLMCKVYVQLGEGEVYSGIG